MAENIHSSNWVLAVSDIAGCTQLVPRQTIGASYGDALLAVIGAGVPPADTATKAQIHRLADAD
ncbi:hypothetical protein ACAG24_004840 [Mycobacterium sp. pW049]|uniref:hypothetical protein n=1 Tax=[Mycobacterium] bulgaricum TaxID=3238985 RepID=UPI00351B975A